MTLINRGRVPSNVFDLLGRDENSASFALGWTLEHNTAFKKAFVECLIGVPPDLSKATISLQKFDEDGGYTDIEIHNGSDLHIIIEAKKGWLTPTIEQLKRYRPRLNASGASRRLLVSMSSARADIVQRTLPTDLDGVPIVHLSWRDVRRMATSSMKHSKRAKERVWLDHFSEHLREFVAMERSTDNAVFVVSLGRRPMIEGGVHTWVDVVERDKCYFHPVGRSWPVQPPNYIGFRYDGRLQSVHHVDSFVIAADVSAINPLWLSTEVDHFVYKLGPAMRPVAEIRTGAINRNARCHCAIDTLLSGAFKTISDARDASRERLAAKN